MPALPLLLALAVTGIAPSFDANGLVTVDAHLNGLGPFRLLVDTGATTTMLDESVAAGLSLRPSRRVELLTTTGSWTADAGIVAHLAIGTFAVRDLEVSWTNLGRLRTLRSDLAGVVGQDVLSRATLTIDYGARRVRVDGGGRCEPGDRRAAAAWLDGRPAIDARLRDPSLPRRVRLVIDSAADALLLFAPPLSHGPAVLRSHHGATHASALASLDVGVAGMWSRVRAARARVTGRDEHGLLPASTFRRVCIDGPRSEVVVVAW
jgi:hypothetical protein